MCDPWYKKKRLLIDPGFGFSKNTFHNYQLLANLSQLKNFNLPILISVSRKSMIGNILKNKPSERLIGSIACAVIAGMQGVNIIRTHDVKETLEAMKIVNATCVKKDKLIL